MFSLDQLRIFTEPQQGATYDDLLAVARRAEQLGFGAFFRSDHYLAMGGALEAGGLPGPTDAWTTLAGLARDTSTIRLGTLVTSATFRLPGPLAITVAQVDADVGRPRRARPRRRVVRAGARGVRHPVPRARRALRPPRGAAGRDHRAVVDAGRRAVLLRRPALPRRPTRRRCPSRCRTAACRSSSAAAGPTRTPALAARYAAEYNTPFVTIERFTEQQARVGRGVRGDRPRPGVAALLGGRRRVPRRRRGRVRAPGRGHRTRARRAAPQRGRRHARRGRRHAPSGGSTPAPSGCTSRCSTSPISITSTPSPPSAAAESDASGGHMEHRRIEIAEGSM